MGTLGVTKIFLVLKFVDLLSWGFLNQLIPKGPCKLSVLAAVSGLIW